MTSKPHQLFRISPLDLVYTAGGDADPQRFVSDVKYLTRYAAGMVRALGARTLERVLLEDASSQTAFYYAGSPNGAGPVVNGIFTRTPHPPEDLLAALDD